MEYNGDPNGTVKGAREGARVSRDCGYNLSPGGGDGTKHANMERRKAKRREVAQKGTAPTSGPAGWPAPPGLADPLRPFARARQRPGLSDAWAALGRQAHAREWPRARARSVISSRCPWKPPGAVATGTGERRNDSRWRRTWTSSWMRSNPSFADQTHSDWAWSSGPEAASAASSATTGTKPKRKRISG